MSAAEKGGRNDAMNVAALKLGHYVAGAGLDQDTVIDALMGAARECGLLDEEDGERSAKTTIRSGLRAGKKTLRAVPVPPDRADAPPDGSSQRLEDALIGERIARDHLQEFVYAKGLGWLKFDGRGGCLSRRSSSAT